MAYLPIFLDLTDRKCLVVGGGEVAARKIATLVQAGADVLVVSPTVTDAIAELVKQGMVRHQARKCVQGDMHGAALVYAATDDPALHQRLSAEARGRGIPINVADVPALCTFIAPAVLRRGALTIAVSTSGASPGLAKRIVEQLEGLFGPEYGIALEVLRAARHHLKATEVNIQTRAVKLTSLATSRIPQHIREDDFDAVNRILIRTISTDLQTLGLGRFLGDGIAKSQPEENTPAT